MTVQPFSLERVKEPLQQFGFAFLRERVVNPADANEKAAQTDGGILVWMRAVISGLDHVHAGPSTIHLTAGSGPTREKDPADSYTPGRQRVPRAYSNRRNFMHLESPPCHHPFSHLTIHT